MSSILLIWSETAQNVPIVSLPTVWYLVLVTFPDRLLIQAGVYKMFWNKTISHGTLALSCRG